MAELSVIKAYTAGLRVIQRDPLAPPVWGLLAFAAYLGLELAMWGTISSAYGPLLSAQAGGQTLDQSQAVAMVGQVFGMGLIFMVVALILIGIQYSAAIRAVLKPEDKGFFYLRFGKAELLLILLGLVQALCSIPVVVALEFAVIMLVGIVSVIAHSVAVTGVISVILAIPAIGVFLWLWARFSMAGPMSFAEGRLRLFKSWELTKGHSLKLVGLAALMFATVVGIEIVFLVPFYLLGGQRAVVGMVNRPDIMSSLPILLAAGIPGGIIGGYAYAFFLAPWADAYNQLRGPSAVEEVF
ncbi:MAG: hypothetical protein JWM33_1188 [Caulobacteraceae bacterium]|nr:hypothetical protein [Caulobacteraceae bacterium]